MMEEMPKPCGICKGCERGSGCLMQLPPKAESWRELNNRDVLQLILALLKDIRDEIINGNDKRAS